MPDLTPLYSFPYPTGTDRLDEAVSTIPQALAEEVESTIAGFGGIASPGSWQAPTLLVGANIGGGFRVTEYRKIGVVVYLRGVLGFGGGVSSGTTLFTLASGYRPTETETFLIRSSAGNAWLDVQTDGDVVLQTTLGVGGNCSLSGATFAID